MILDNQISVEHSDAVTGCAPNQSQRVQQNPSNYNYYKVMEKTGPKSKKHHLWMEKLGAFLSTERKSMIKPLADFPKGYELLEHNKTLGGGRKPRKDAYLYGHPSRQKFRSPNEFMPHLLWLSQGMRAENPCGCCLCKGRLIASAPDKNKVMTSQISEVKRKAVRLSMISASSKVRLEQAWQARDRDQSQYAHVYRIGEVVLLSRIRSTSKTTVVSADRDHEYIVIKQGVRNSDIELCRTRAEALLQHTYDLINVRNLEDKVLNVSHARIRPYLSVDHSTLQEADLIRTASPIVKYSTLEHASQLPGPCYAGWFLGPEKIWENDLVRLDDGREGAVEVMHVHHIVLDVPKKLVKLRGDIYLISDEYDPTETRPIDPRIFSAVNRKDKNIKFINPPGHEYFTAMAETLGRFYTPEEYDGQLFENSPVNIVSRGRASAMGLDENSEVNNLFDLTAMSAVDVEELAGARMGEKESLARCSDVPDDDSQFSSREDLGTRPCPKVVRDPTSPTFKHQKDIKRPAPTIAAKIIKKKKKRN